MVTRRRRAARAGPAGRAASWSRPGDDRARTRGRDESPRIPARQRPGQRVLQVRPAKYSCVAKTPAMAVQSRNTPNWTLRARAKFRRRVTRTGPSSAAAVLIVKVIATLVDSPPHVQRPAVHRARPLLVIPSRRSSQCLVGSTPAPGRLAARGSCPASAACRSTSRAEDPSDRDKGGFHETFSPHATHPGDRTRTGGHGAQWRASGVTSRSAPEPGQAVPPSSLPLVFA